MVLGCARVSRVDFSKVRPFPAQMDRSSIDAPSMLPLHNPGPAADGPLTSQTSGEKFVVANAV